MHIYFSGIGGAGIGPLAQIAHQAGYSVSGSDKRDSSYIEYLRKAGIHNIHIDQSTEAIAAVHDAEPIDWFVYTSALPLENPNAPELVFCRQQSIKTSKRDELLNQILSDKNLDMIAIAGTHGKTTTTAMVVWLLRELGESFSYNLPAKVSFASMGHYEPDSRYFVYEADEFDRNFLHFEPHISIISGVTWDHHEIFPTREDYQQAFRDFINQSRTTVLWQDEYDYLSLDDGVASRLIVQDADDTGLQAITLHGLYNRHDAWLAIHAVHDITSRPISDLIEIINRFPGANRRMERIADNLYSDYAHTPEKVRGAMSVALEMAEEKGQELIVVYEPLTNRRQHYLKEEYKDSFAGASKLYWIPSYLAREDPDQPILTPSELITYLDNQDIAIASERDDELKAAIAQHIADGAMVVAMAGGGGGSLDEWLRQNFAS